MLQIQRFSYFDFMLKVPQSNKIYFYYQKLTDMASPQLESKGLSRLLINPHSFIAELSDFNQQIDQSTENKQQKINAMFQKLYDIIEELQRLRETQILAEHNRVFDLKVSQVYNLAFAPQESKTLKEQISDNYLMSEGTDRGKMCESQLQMKTSNISNLHSEYYQTQMYEKHIKYEQLETEKSTKVSQMVIKLKGKKMAKSSVNETPSKTPIQKRSQSRASRFQIEAKIKTFR